MIKTAKTKKEKNREYREKVRRQACEKIILLAKLCTAEGGGDVRFAPQKSTSKETE